MKIDPIYPPLARQNNIEGAVKVEITIAPDGSVKQVRSLGRNPVLSQAVENAVKQWHYTSGPADHDADFDFAIQTLGTRNRASGK